MGTCTGARDQVIADYDAKNKFRYGKGVRPPCPQKCQPYWSGQLVLYFADPRNADNTWVVNVTIQTGRATPAEVRLLLDCAELWLSDGHMCRRCLRQASESTSMWQSDSVLEILRDFENLRNFKCAIDRYDRPTHRFILKNPFKGCRNGIQNSEYNSSKQDEEIQLWWS